MADSHEEKELAILIISLVTFKNMCACVYISISEISTEFEPHKYT